MPPATGLNRSIAVASARRTAEIVGALGAFEATGGRALSTPSGLPGWTRLTIACHLRYGAEALLRMTSAGITGERTAYYPGGRLSQRPRTLQPAPGEGPQEVVESLRRLSVELDHVWDNLDDRAWGQEVLEPADNPDLGTLRVSGLPLVRLTEVEVHGIDLDLGLDDWSDLFVRTALPARLGRLGTRRPNRGEVDHLRQGTLLLVATDGPTFTLSVNRDHVEAHPGDPMAPATAVIEATSRDLLALLLGRPLVGAPRIAGDETFIDAFRSAFPGP